MKERISDSDFVNNVRTNLKALIGKKLKVTIRGEKKNLLKTYEGTLQSVGENTFILKNTFGDDGLFEFKIIDVHYYGTLYEKEQFGTWPARYRYS